MKAYFDSAPVIYVVERTPGFAPRVDQWLQANVCDIHTSRLCRLEVLVLPVRQNDGLLIADFERFFRLRVAKMVPLNRASYNQAIRIRADNPSFRTPDALHLAMAIQSGCDVFLTNDKRLKSFTGIRVEVI